MAFNIPDDIFTQIGRSPRTMAQSQQPAQGGFMSSLMNPQFLQKLAGLGIGLAGGRGAATGAATQLQRQEDIRIQQMERDREESERRQQRAFKVKGIEQEQERISQSGKALENTRLYQQRMEEIAKRSALSEEERLKILGRKEGREKLLMSREIGTEERSKQKLMVRDYFGSGQTDESISTAAQWNATFGGKIRPIDFLTERAKGLEDNRTRVLENTNSLFEAAASYAAFGLSTGSLPIVLKDLLNDEDLAAMEVIFKKISKDRELSDALKQAELTSKLYRGLSIGESYRPLVDFHPITGKKMKEFVAGPSAASEDMNARIKFLTESGLMGGTVDSRIIFKALFKTDIGTLDEDTARSLGLIISAIRIVQSQDDGGGTDDPWSDTAKLLRSQGNNRVADLMPELIEGGEAFRLTDDQLVPNPSRQQELIFKASDIASIKRSKGLNEDAVESALQAMVQDPNTDLTEQEIEFIRRRLAQ